MAESGLNMTSMLCQKQPGGQVRVHDGELVEDLIVDSHGHITTTVSWDTCTLPGTMVQSVHVAYDKWVLKPPYPLKCIQVITANHIKRFKK